jgi:hypothetical protein
MRDRMKIGHKVCEESVNGLREIGTLKLCH